MRPNLLGAAVVCAIVAGFCLAAICEAQTRIVIATGDTLNLSWSHPWTDVSGDSESVAAFGIWLSVNNEPFVLVGQTTDTQTFRPETTYQLTGLAVNSRIVVAVTAHDVAGNASDFHRSTDQSALPGPWYISTDAYEPSKPFGLRVQ